MNQQPRLDVLQRLVTQHAVDIAMLAESPMNPADVLAALNNGSARYHFNPGQCRRIAIFSNRATPFIQPIQESHHLTARRLVLPARQDLLLVVVHLPSTLNRTDASHDYDCREAAEFVRDCEAQVGHRRTIVVGDFNKDPFDTVMVAAGGFHAIMDRRIALKGSRTVNGKERPFFYNPMWSLLGDASRGPPGTFHRAKGEQVTYFWHMLDQVLLRSELLSAFNVEDLQILASDGHIPLLNPSGVPDPSLTSDHLPILFKLDI